MKKYLVAVFMIIFLYASCRSSSPSTSTNGGGTGNSNQHQNNPVTPLSYPKPEVDFNAPVLDLSSTDDSDTISNFLADCIGVVKNESEFIEKLFVADEDFDDLTSTGNNTWRGDDFSVVVSKATDYTYLNFSFDIVSGVGSERTLLKIKNDRSYAEVVAYQNGSPYITARANFQNNGEKGEVMRYGGYFEELAAILTYSSDSTSDTGKVELYQNGKMGGEVTLSEDDQSNPTWGECVQRSIYEGSLLLDGYLKWNMGHGEYHIIFRNSDGSINQELKGKF